MRVQPGFAWFAALSVIAGCGDRPPLLFRGPWPDAGLGRDVERVDRPPVDVVPCLPGPDAATCSAPRAGCGPREICDNGIDDDCDSFIDLDCDCVPGAVEPCSYGTPGQRGVGRCRIGTHRCMGAGATGRWGACEDSIGPAAEVCDGLDNDCDGCVDESLCCHNDFSCPGQGDPRGSQTSARRGRGKTRGQGDAGGLGRALDRRALGAARHRGRQALERTSVRPPGGPCPNGGHQLRASRLRCADPAIGMVRRVL